MTPTMIAALASGLSVVISAVFAGLLQLQHNRTYHGDAAPPQAGGQSSPSKPPGGSA